MSHQIAGYIDAEPQPESGYFVTQFNWSAPSPEDDVESFIRAMTTSFATELRGTIEKANQ